MSEMLTSCPPGSTGFKPDRVLGTTDSSSFPPQPADSIGGVKRTIQRLRSVPSIRLRTPRIQSRERASTATPDLASAGRISEYLDRAASATPDSRQNLEY